MMPRPGFSLPALLLLVICTASQSLADISLPNSDGSTLVLESTAGRVITLAPNLAEMVFDAGAGSRLLATVEYSNYPEQAARLPRIGDAFRFDLEQILAFQPDLVIAWSSGNPAAALERLESLGLKVWRTEMREPMDIAALLENIALATGIEQAGKEAASRVRQTLRQLEEQYAGKSPVSYFYQVAERPLFTLNGNHIVSRGLALCGGVNVFSGQTSLAPQITRESVLLADAEVFFAPFIPGSGDPLEHWQSWPRLRAVRNDALHHLDADGISRATPRMLDSLQIACTLLDRNRTQNLNTGENP
jgi:iron complex transport system substrate-binding protein